MYAFVCVLRVLGWLNKGRFLVIDIFVAEVVLIVLIRSTYLWGQIPLGKWLRSSSRNVALRGTRKSRGLEISGQRRGLERRLPRRARSVTPPLNPVCLVFFRVGPDYLSHSRHISVARELRAVRVVVAGAGGHAQGRLSRVREWQINS